MWRCSCTGRVSGFANASTAWPTCSINVCVSLFSLSITSSLPANCASSALYLSANSRSCSVFTPGKAVCRCRCSSRCFTWSCERSAASISRSIRSSCAFSRPALALVLLTALTSVSLRSSYISIERPLLFSSFIFLWFLKFSDWVTISFYVFFSVLPSCGDVPSRLWPSLRPRH